MGLLGKLTGSDAKKKAASKARKDTLARESAALGQLTPEAMQAMMQQFYQKYMGILGPGMMKSQQSLSAGTGGVGLGRAGLTRSLRAGIPSMYQNKALEMAIAPAMQTATNRSNVIMGRDIVQDPGTSGLSDMFNMGASYIGDLGKLYLNKKTPQAT